MKITENTKGLVGSVTHIDTQKLNKLIEERDKYKKALEEIAQKVKRKNVVSHIYIQKIIDGALK